MAEEAKNAGTADRQKAFVYRVAVLLMLATTVMVVFKARNLDKEYDHIGVPVESHAITFTGEGRAIGVPDVAKMRLGMTVERPTVLEAQEENTGVMNTLVGELKGLGIDAADIQTSDYSVYPTYDYTDGRQVLRGYQVSQSVQVSVRDLDNVGKVLGTVGRLGLNQVGGIEFVVDDPHGLQAEARIAAVADAKRKAQDLATAVGVRLGRVVDIREAVSDGSRPPLYFDKAMGLGGGEGPPMAEPGSAEVVVTASITYEIEN